MTNAMYIGLAILRCNGEIPKETVWRYMCLCVSFGGEEIEEIMVLKTVLKVQLSSDKCKKKILKSISGLEGVYMVEIDVLKGTLTVMGDADPYEILLRTKKVGKFVEVVTIGPPPPPPKKPEEKKPEEKKPPEKKPEEKKLEEKKPEEKVHFHPNNFHSPQDCVVCRQITMEYMNRWDGPGSNCTVM